MSQPQFRVFDLCAFEQADEAGKRKLGKEVDAICRTTGFLAISNHGVPQAVIDAVWGKAHAFFDLPPEEKQNARAPYKGYPYGYLGPELEALAKSREIDSPPDLKENRRQPEPSEKCKKPSRHGCFDAKFLHFYPSTLSPGDRSLRMKETASLNR